MIGSVTSKQKVIGKRKITDKYIKFCGYSCFDFYFYSFQCRIVWLYDFICDFLFMSKKLGYQKNKDIKKFWTLNIENYSKQRNLCELII